MSEYVIRIPGWRPTPLNKLLAVHWRKRSKYKKADAEMIAVYAKMCCIPPADQFTRRRVSVEITLSGRQQEADVDAYWKSLLDGLVACGALWDDDTRHCVTCDPKYVRGQKMGTVVTLVDVPMEGRD